MENAQEMQETTMQLQHLQNYLQAVEEQLQEVTMAIESIDQLQKVEKKTEMYAPLADGVYIKAQLAEKKEYLLSVGEGVTVKKKGEEVKTILSEQLEEIREVQENLVQQFTEAYQRYAQLQMQG